MRSEEKMTCDDAQALLDDDRRGRLDPARKTELDAHLDACAACRRVRDEELALDGALAKLPRHPAPPKLRVMLEEQAKARPERTVRRGPWIAGGAAFALAMAAAIFLLVRFVLPARDETLVREAVNDHLRV